MPLSLTCVSEKGYIVACIYIIGKVSEEKISATSCIVRGYELPL